MIFEFISKRQTDAAENFVELYKFIILITTVSLGITCIYIYIYIALCDKVSVVLFINSII